MAMPSRGSLILILVFLLGALAGVAGTVWLGPHITARLQPHDPQKGKQEFLRHVRKELDLSPEQATQFNAIAEQTWSRWDALHQQMEPQFESIRMEGRAKLRALMNPEQVQKFDRMLAEFDAARRKHPGHP